MSTTEDLNTVPWEWKSSHYDDGAWGPQGAAEVQRRESLPAIADLDAPLVRVATEIPTGNQRDDSIWADCAEDMGKGTCDGLC